MRTPSSPAVSSCQACGGMSTASPGRPVAARRRPRALHRLRGSGRSLRCVRGSGAASPRPLRARLPRGSGDPCGSTRESSSRPWSRTALRPHRGSGAPPTRLYRPTCALNAASVPSPRPLDPQRPPRDPRDPCGQRTRGPLTAGSRLRAESVPTRYALADDRRTSGAPTARRSRQRARRSPSASCRRGCRAPRARPSWPARSPPTRR